MQSISGLVARLERAEAPDRRLDAEIVGCVLAPQGWFINPFRAPDGWDIELAGEDGETSYWMEADDVPRLTRLLEDAIAFANQVRPGEAATIIYHALRHLPEPSAEDTAVLYTQRAARTLVAEVLRTVARNEMTDLVGAGRADLAHAGQVRHAV